MASMSRELEEERNGRDSSPKEHKMEDLRGSMTSFTSSNSRLGMMEKNDSTPSGFSRENVISGLKDISQGFVIYPDDRCGNTPFDEARLSGNNQLIKLLEEAKSAQIFEFPSVSHEISEKKHLRKCTVFPFHPWEPKDLRKHGVVLWVPMSMEELVTAASEQLNFPSGSCILSEDAGKILDIDMISDGQKLYLISETT